MEAGLPRALKRLAGGALAAVLCCLAACAAPGPAPVWTAGNVPAYSGEPYVALSGNEPGFLPGELTANSYEFYSPLDELGRCGPATACVGTDLMGVEERGSISSVEPSGWQSVRYDCVDGDYLYNRCHLIGYQLSGENANKQNLITGTRYLNVEGMLPFERLVADYVRETENHVLYRVTPLYDGDDLVAAGVQMEAVSVEDGGEGVSFNVYVYNVQPGVEIDYATGDSRLSGGPAREEEDGDAPEIAYVLNVKSKKFHLPSCPGVAGMKEENRRETSAPRSEVEAQGYAPCGTCKP